MNSLHKDFYRQKWRATYLDLLNKKKEELSQKICNWILDSSLFQTANLVGIFSALPWEPCLESLWIARPKNCVFPAVLSPLQQIEFRFISALQDLQPGFAKIKEPPQNALVATEWNQSDLILVPGSAFDRNGGRVGSGYGFYDRFLLHCPAFKMGVCFLEQVTSACLPQETFDQKINGLCTQAGIEVFVCS